MRDGRRIYGWFGALIVCQVVMVLTQFQSVTLLKRIDSTTTISEKTIGNVSALLLTNISQRAAEQIERIENDRHNTR